MLNNNFVLLFIFCHFFIQALWTLSSRGENWTQFVQTWKRVHSIPIVIFETIAFLQVLVLPWFSLPKIYEPASVVQIVGLLIAVWGCALASWAKLVMGKSWGRPAQHNIEKQNALVTNGPFRYSRNPIYVGLWLLFTGQQIALGSSGLILSSLFAFVIYKAVSTEEILLEKYFGNNYIEYKKRVPRFL